VRFVRFTITSNHGHAEFKEITIKGGAGTDRTRKDAADKTSGVEKLF
jgi:hypothetical protein